MVRAIPDNLEVRSFSEDLRVDAALGTFEGHASAFNFVDSYDTAFLKGAFRKTLAERGDKIPVTWFHDPTEIVGPSLELREDGTGLFHKSKAVDDGQTGTYVLAHLRGGTQMGMSFGFKTMRDRVATDADPIDMSTARDGLKRSDVRAIVEVRLDEIAVLPWVFASQKKAEITAVRDDRLDALAGLLPSLLDDLRAGRLDAERLALIDQIVAAREDAGPASEALPPTSTDEARRTVATDLELMLWELSAAVEAA